MKRTGIKGTSERPRISVCRSNKNIFTQLIDDTDRKTLFSLSTLHREIKDKFPKSAANIKAAEKLGEVFARMAKEKGFSKVVFDRGAWPYHGRIRAFAEALRKGGLEF